MRLLNFINFFRRFKNLFTKKKTHTKDLVINNLILAPNPKYQGKLWGYRPETMVEHIIVHQALSEATTVDIHNYHISDTSHLKSGGAPKIAYHYTIEKDGTVYQVNDITDVVWHCRGQNLTSIGIMLCGDFSGSEHVGRSKPTKEQLSSLKKLLDTIISDLNLKKTCVVGHSDFGKPACPGFNVESFINKYRR